jgi:hypothetical protein
LFSDAAAYDRPVVLRGQRAQTLQETAEPFRNAAAGQQPDSFQIQSFIPSAIQEFNVRNLAG